ncbi:hypothetical protein RM553_14745 [Zunongwangia sp. F363]|uniref:Transposase IS200-like domain-containing protein n=1 Tax=Autumnicola tepida TaxID=3075595 RepID=A0ABU3CCM6_9FLAO|nr:hypothetical protein [Zunongwangia sp. F363]MDT0644093.1 hypothetical protein [Zunongwangia sp. F363]
MIPLEPDKFHHGYNRANGNENIFKNKENYRFFLQQYKKYIVPLADTFCYCLMPNHFHFLFRIKSEPELKKLVDFPNSPAVEKFLSKGFSNFFSSYTQAFNKQQNRRGSLFMKNFKRKCIEKEDYLYNLIPYIHNNPVAAKLCEKAEDWEFSSYNSIISEKPTLLQREEILEYFDGRSNFISFHKKPNNDNFSC